MPRATFDEFYGQSRWVQPVGYEFDAIPEALYRVADTAEALGYVYDAARRRWNRAE